MFGVTKAIFLGFCMSGALMMQEIHEKPLTEKEAKQVQHYIDSYNRSIAKFIDKVCGHGTFRRLQTGELSSEVMLGAKTLDEFLAKSKKTALT
jgi:hypothetical protein